MKIIKIQKNYLFSINYNTFHTYFNKQKFYKIDFII